MPPHTADALRLREVLEQGRDEISKGFQKEEVEEERYTTCREKNIKIRKKKKRGGGNWVELQVKNTGRHEIFLLCARFSAKK